MITLVAFHFGNPAASPAWLPMFVERLAANPMLRLLLLTNRYDGDMPPNLTIERMAFWQLMRLCTDRLGYRCRRDEPYGLCDFRPAFGHIFEQELSDSDWWGWCDLDIVLGRVASFITPELLDTYDVISGASYCTDGPFTIVRNVPELRRLYMGEPFPQVPIHPNRAPAVYCANVQTMYGTGLHTGWGEWGFTQLVDAAESRGELRKHFAHWQAHDRQRPAVGCQLIGEHLVETPSGREIMYYHFPGSKRWPL